MEYHQEQVIGTTSTEPEAVLEYNNPFTTAETLGSDSTFYFAANEAQYPSDYSYGQEDYKVVEEGNGDGASPHQLYWENINLANPSQAKEAQDVVDASWVAFTSPPNEVEVVASQDSTWNQPLENVPSISPSLVNTNENNSIIFSKLEHAGVPSAIFHDGTEEICQAAALPPPKPKRKNLPGSTPRTESHREGGKDGGEFDSRNRNVASSQTREIFVPSDSLILSGSRELFQNPVSSNVNHKGALKSHSKAVLTEAAYDSVLQTSVVVIPQDKKENDQFIQQLQDDLFKTTSSTNRVPSQSTYTKEKAASSRIDFMSQQTEKKHHYDAKAEKESIVSCPNDYMGKQIVELDIGGKIFHCKRSLLEKFPGKRLHRMMTKELERGSNYLFIDRNEKYFEPILDWYRTGKVYESHALDKQRMIDEATYFDIFHEMFPPTTSPRKKKNQDDQLKAASSPTKATKKKSKPAGSKKETLDQEERGSSIATGSVNDKSATMNESLYFKKTLSSYISSTQKIPLVHVLHPHEQLILESIRGHGTLYLRVTKMHGEVVVKKATVYDSSLHFFMSSQQKIPLQNTPLPGGFIYTFWLEDCPTAALQNTSSTLTNSTINHQDIFASCSVMDERLSQEKIQMTVDFQLIACFHRGEEICQASGQKGAAPAFATKTTLDSIHAADTLPNSNEIFFSSFPTLSEQPNHHPPRFSTDFNTRSQHENATTTDVNMPSEDHFQRNTGEESGRSKGTNGPFPHAVMGLGFHERTPGNSTSSAFHTSSFTEGVGSAMTLSTGSSQATPQLNHHVFTHREVSWPTITKTVAAAADPHPSSSIKDQNPSLHPPSYPPQYHQVNYDSNKDLSRASVLEQATRDGTHEVPNQPYDELSKQVKEKNKTMAWRLHAQQNGYVIPGLVTPSNLEKNVLGEKNHSLRTLKPQDAFLDMPTFVPFKAELSSSTHPVLPRMTQHAIHHETSFTSETTSKGTNQPFETRHNYVEKEIEATPPFRPLHLQSQMKASSDFMVPSLDATSKTKVDGFSNHSYTTAEAHSIDKKKISPKLPPATYAKLASQSQSQSHITQGRVIRRNERLERLDQPRFR